MNKSKGNYIKKRKSIKYKRNKKGSGKGKGTKRSRSNSESRSSNSSKRNRSGTGSSNRTKQNRRSDHSSNHEDCAVCLQSLNEEENILLKCGHKFHKHCINRAIRVQRHNKCPMCRFEPTPPTDSENEERAEELINLLERNGNITDKDIEDIFFLLEKLRYDDTRGLLSYAFQKYQGLLQEDQESYYEDRDSE